MQLKFNSILDLSQPLYDGAPGAALFPAPSVKRIKSQPADGFNLELISLTTHTGTHLDAPFHFFQDGKPVDALLPGDLVGRAVAVDLYAKKPSEPITARDLAACDSLVGPDAVVLLCTGWGEKRRARDPAYFESPYLTGDGARWLADRRVKGVGIDHFSVSGTDYERSVPPHLILLGAGIWIVEDLYLPRVLLDGKARCVMVLPLSIEGASGAPARAVAFEDEDAEDGCLRRMAPGVRVMRLPGRVAMVTGAARGIGKAIAVRLAEEGADVALCDILAEPLEEAASAVARTGRRAFPARADVACGGDVRRMVEEVLEAFGRVDILVNNAGVSPLAPFEEITEGEWDRVMAVNLKGAFLCAQAVAGPMKARKHGRIINICSAGAKVGGLITGAHYVASKAGLLGLTRSLARQLAPWNVTVNSVSPGPVDSEMLSTWSSDSKVGLAAQIPLGRLGLPAEVAAAVAYLASDDASFVTGENLDVNGGFVMD